MCIRDRIYPTVQSEEDYGHYLIDELDELELPEEAKQYFMYEEYGRDAVINDKGRLDVYKRQPRILHPCKTADWR